MTTLLRRVDIQRNEDHDNDNQGVERIGFGCERAGRSISSKSATVWMAPTTISWLDVQLFPNGTITQALTDVWEVSRLVALDDERVVIAGSGINWDEPGYANAFVEQIGPMGLEWEGRYDRALEWCKEDDLP
jgi:hypothetical protein